MESTFVSSVLLPVALAIVMLGLGLSLQVDDFKRVARMPKAVATALVCQIIILPLICFGLVIAFDLEPLLAVGMMLLVASPGGTTANLLSHLARGDVALNVSLTAVNSITAVFTMPLVVNFAIGYFVEDGRFGIGMQFDKVAQVFAIVLIPVAIGMLIRRYRESFALAMQRPVKVLSVIVLLGAIAVAIYQERDNFWDYIQAVGLVALLLNLISLAIGYAVPKLIKLGEPQAIACSMEIGIHNAVLAITLAVTVLESTEMSIPPAVYGIVMFIPSGIFAYLLGRRAASRASADRT